MRTTITDRNELITHKLRSGMKFGLYEGGKNCYLADGTKLRYDELWTMLRDIKGLEPGHKTTLPDLCPEAFLGTFSYKFRFKWLKMGAAFFKQAHHA